MISRSILDSLLPEGPIYEPETGGDYDLLLDGISENSEAVRLFLKALAWIRNPNKTEILSDLEKEYGIIPPTLATEEERRAQLAAFIYNRNSTGAWDVLQQKLRDSGFPDVYVHPNDPAVDPNIFLEQAFNMTCGDLLPGGNDAQCGEVEAVCAIDGGELLVNGDLFKNVPDYLHRCGEPSYCGDDVFAGDFDGYSATILDERYTVPTDAGYWPLIFFVGGPATRDPGTGALTEIKFYSVPLQRRSEFRRMILKYKPMHSWAGLIVIYN